MKLLHEAGEDIPRFVSHYIDEFPPVTFNSLDVSCLLGKIERLSTDMTSMKHAMCMQTNVCEDLREITADMNQRICRVEQPVLSGRDAPIGQVNEEAPSRSMRSVAPATGASALDASAAEGPWSGKTTRRQCHLCGAVRSERVAA